MLSEGQLASVLDSQPLLIHLRFIRNYYLALIGILFVCACRSVGACPPPLGQ